MKAVDSSAGIVGIICQDGIVLASESQITMGGLRLPHGDKISVINFPQGKKALVAESGDVSLSNHVVDLMKRQAYTKQIASEDTIAETLQECVIQARSEQMRLYPRRKYSISEWDYLFQTIS